MPRGVGVVAKSLFQSFSESHLFLPITESDASLWFFFIYFLAKKKLLNIAYRPKSRYFALIIIFTVIFLLLG